MQSIITKYIPATDKRGARIKATATGGTSVTIKLDPELSTEAMHLVAARALAEENDWGHLCFAQGGTEDGGSVFVLLPYRDGLADGEFIHDRTRE